MPITRTPWLDDDGTGTTGTILNNAEKQSLYNQIDAVIVPFEAAGVWIAVPYASGNFRGADDAWVVEAGDQTVFKYTIVGKTMTVQVNLANTSPAGGSSSLLITLPAGKNPSGTFTGWLSLNDNGTGWKLGYASVISGFNVILCQINPAGTLWAASANLTSLNCQITFEFL